MKAGSKTLLAAAFLWAAAAHGATPDKVAPAKTPTPAEKVPTPEAAAAGKPRGSMKFSPEVKAELIKQREQAAAQRRTQAIKMLEELLAMKPGEATASDALYKLAELYWEDSRQQYVAAMAVYDQKSEACRAAGSDTAAGKDECRLTPPRLDVSRSEKLYKEIVANHPKTKRIDVVLYLLGFGAHEAGRREEATSWLSKLIEQHPDSQLVPDAWMMLGEGHFAGANFAKAREAYAKVLQHRDSPVYDLALFKSAWCDWKLGETRRAAERFKEVLDIASAAEKSQNLEQRRRSIQLKDEALNYLTLLFTEDESVTAKDAYDFLASIGGERYSREVLGRLADLFSAQGRYDRAIQAWKHLVTLDPNHADSPRHQLRIVESFMAMDFPEDAVKEAKLLAANYGPGSGWQKSNKSRQKAVAEVNAQIEEALGVLGKRMHGDAQADEERRKKPDVAAYKRASELYAFYLKQYPETPRAAEVRFLRAEILFFKLESFEEAGDEYMVVGQLKPVGPRNKDALLKAMSAYEKLRPKDAEKRRKPTEADKKFAAAVDAFAREFPADPDVVGVIYKNGQMFFDYGDYDEAVKRFGLIVTKYPNDPNAGAAGDRILEALAKGEDYANIEEWAKKLKSAKSFQAQSEQNRLDEIIVQAIGKIAEKNIKDGKPEEAAKVYLRVAKEYPNDKRAPQSVMNAGTTYEAAKQPLAAADAYLMVVEKYPAAPVAAGAAFNAGRVYEQMAYFDKAADAYSVVAYKYAGDAKAADALFNVAVLNQALGQTQDAIKANTEYARRYPKQKDIEETSFRVGIVYSEANDHQRAAQAYELFVRRYPTSPRVVEAQTRAGRAYLALNQGKRAEKELEEALGRWKKLGKNGQKETARWAAEARYLQGESVFAQYQGIQLDVKPKALKTALERKKELLAKAQGIYTDVVSYGDPSWATAGLHRIGQIYEQFADQLRKLPPPPGLSEEEQQVYREEVDRYVIDMEDKAAAIYEGGYRKALDLKVYGESTRRLREALGRLSENKFPPEREARARTRVGDKPPEIDIVRDVSTDE